MIKLLTPEMLSRALAEWVLAQGGLDVNQRCRVDLQFAMTRVEGCPTEFKSCRVDVEVE